jgi:DNA polymerase-3 subunit delta
MPTRAAKTALSIIVIYGDEDFQKQTALAAALNALLPPEVDRTLALTTYDGAQGEEQGGPSFAAVADDLATLPFLSPRRVVVVRDADRFITAARERLERWVAAPPPTGTLILECRSFPSNTRLAKAAVAGGGKVIECRKLYGKALIAFAEQAAQTRGKQLVPAAAERLVNLIGQDQGAIDAEVEKLSLYVGGRPKITPEDVAALVGLSREEKVFAVMDAAALGRLPEALGLWQQVLSTDPDAVYKAVGGVAFVLRKWLTAHRLVADGAAPAEIAPKVMMYGRAAELATILRRLPAARVAAVLAQLGTLDAQAKSGTRSIERGIEGLLVELASPAA